MILMTKFDRVPPKRCGETYTDAEAVIGFEMDRIGADRLAAVCIKQGDDYRCWTIPFKNGDDVDQWNADIATAVSNARSMHQTM